MSFFKALNFLVAFLLELIALVGFSCIGFLVSGTMILKITISLLLLISLVIFWGRFMAQKPLDA